MKRFHEQKLPLLPRGLSPHPSLPNPHPRRLGPVVDISSLVVLQKYKETPLHPPYARGDKGLRQANKRPKVRYWHALLAYIDSTYVKKFGKHYPWNNLARKNFWNLARVHLAWSVMALWDLYLAGESVWAHRTAWTAYGLVRDVGWLIDKPQFKRLSLNHEAHLKCPRRGENLCP
jgi:hypothetical protein